MQYIFMEKSYDCSWFTLDNTCHSGEQRCKANDFGRWGSQNEDRKMEVIIRKPKQCLDYSDNSNTNVYEPMYQLGL